MSTGLTWGGVHDLIACAFHISTDTDLTQCANWISAHHSHHWLPIRDLLDGVERQSGPRTRPKVSYSPASQSPNRHKFEPHSVQSVLTIQPTTKPVVNRLHLDNSIGRLASPSSVHGLQRGCSSRAETTSCRVRCNNEPHNAAWLPL